MSAKRTHDEVLSPDLQINRGKRHMISSPPGLGAILKLNRNLLELSEKDITDTIDGISPEGVEITKLVHQKNREIAETIMECLDTMQERLEEICNQKKGMEREINALKTENKLLKQRVENQENYSRRNNLIIKGIPEGWGQNVDQIVRSFMNDYFWVPYDIPIERMHRLGKFTGNYDRPRPIIVRFVKFADREMVWNARHYLGDSGFGLDEDFSPEVQRVRRKLLPVFLEAKRQHIPAEMVKDSIKLYGQVYTLDTLHTLPKEIRDGSRWTKYQVSFFGELCPASNFHPAKFNHDGTEVENSEKMLFLKMANLFDDEDSMKKIEAESDPRIIKNLSKNITNVDRDKWNSSIKELVTPILMDKFSQNPHLLQWLQSTGDRRLVEAAGPHDKVWGNGLRLSDPNVSMPDHWTGDNLQGQMLMDVRKALCLKARMLPVPLPERVRNLLAKEHSATTSGSGEASVSDEAMVEEAASNVFSSQPFTPTET